MAFLFAFIGLVGSFYIFYGFMRPRYREYWRRRVEDALQENAEKTELMLQKEREHLERLQHYNKDVEQLIESGVKWKVEMHIETRRKIEAEKELVEERERLVDVENKKHLDSYTLVEFFKIYEERLDEITEETLTAEIEQSLFNLYESLTEVNPRLNKMSLHSQSIIPGATNRFFESALVDEGYAQKKKNLYTLGLDEEDIEFRLESLKNEWRESLKEYASPEDEEYPE